LSTFDETLLILDVELGFDLGFIDRLFFLRDLKVVLVLLLRGLIFGLAFVFGDLLDLEVQLFLLLSKKFKLLLLQQLFRDIVGEGFVLQLLEFVFESIVPLDEVLLVFADLALVTLNIWVVLELTTEFASRFFKIFGDSLYMTVKQIIH
jgi:hypothetical protein